MENQRVKVLLIEDTAEDARILREVLAEEKDSPFEITHVTQVSSALKCLAEEPIELVLSDLELPDSKAPTSPVPNVTSAAPATPPAATLRNSRRETPRLSGTSAIWTSLSDSRAR